MRFHWPRSLPFCSALLFSCSTQLHSALTPALFIFTPLLRSALWDCLALAQSQDEDKTRWLCITSQPTGWGIDETYRNCNGTTASDKTEQLFLVFVISSLTGPFSSKHLLCSSFSNVWICSFSLFSITIIKTAGLTIFHYSNILYCTEKLHHSIWVWYSFNNVLEPADTDYNVILSIYFLIASNYL